ncbi:hypothetical protein KEM54_005589 [Ascosphaera aggregata]|nr:hypothetical protein KEM54_005589 [Ascosphaera aggregata]
MAKSKSFEGLLFEKKNQELLRIPKNARISKRPIPHPPPSNPYAGSNAPKIVYVSSRTPFMSAVKRVQKLLRRAETRATAKVDLGRGVGETQKIKQLVAATEDLAGECVYIKATGRAIEKVVNIGEWFQERNEYTVNTKTGTVMVVDDIIENDDPAENSANQLHGRPSLRKKKKSRPLAVDEDGELLESRTRYINTVEVAVTMK